VSQKFGHEGLDAQIVARCRVKRVSWSLIDRIQLRIGHLAGQQLRSASKARFGGRIVGHTIWSVATMIGAIIRFVMSEFGFVFFMLGLVASIIAILRHPPPRTRAVIGDRLLAFYALLPVGMLYLVNFIYHVFFGAMAAHFIGWADSPFQTELGFASLGFAVVGFLAWWGGYPMRVAAVVGPAIFMLGAAGGHIYQIATQNNLAPGNSGLLLWMDVVIPVAGLLFLWIGRPVADQPSHRARL
jgi:hypothetical protein